MYIVKCVFGGIVLGAMCFFILHVSFPGSPAPAYGDNWSAGVQAACTSFPCYPVATASPTAAQP